MNPIVIIIAFIFCAIICVGCLNIKNNAKSNPDITNTVNSSQLSREDLALKLKNLPDKLQKDSLTISAMCYEVAVKIPRNDYICPKCGERTYFKKNYADIENILACRSNIGLIKNLYVELDESLFCGKCSPNAKNPKLILKIKFKGENEFHQIENITANDISLISELSSGSLKHSDFYDNAEPLKNYEARLRILLGIK